VGSRGHIQDVILQVVSSHRDSSSNPLIPVLQRLQEEEGYLSKESLQAVSELLGVSLSRVYGVATFYHQFRLRPEGLHRICVCKGTACHIAGSQELLDWLRGELGLRPGEDSSPDGLFTLQEVRCLGACSLAPVVKIDDEVLGKASPEALKALLDRYRGEV